MPVRVFELASAHSVSVDTVRYYQKIGLLHPPARRGRVAQYDDSHLRRLGEIRRLADAGFSLAQIGQLGDGADEPMLVALGARRDDTLTFDELVEQSGLDAELVRLATDTGLVRPLRTPAGSADEAPKTIGGAAEAATGEGVTVGTLYSTGALTMLRAATELLAAEMPLDDLIGLALRHASNMEAVAADAVGLFADRFAGVPTAQRADLAARLIPLVTDLVAQHFRESLVEHATERILAGDIDDGPARPEATAEAAPETPAAGGSGRRTSAGLRTRTAVTLECRELSGELDPLAVFAASDAHQRVYWACPDGDLEFCALGSAFEAGTEAGTEAGADRFASAAEALSLLDVTMTGDSGHPIGPLAVGGFSFGPEAPAAGSLWEAFGAGCLTVPEVLVMRRGGQSWLTSVPGAPVWPVMAASRSVAGGACATCGVADGSGVCGLAGATGAPSGDCDRDETTVRGGASDELTSTAAGTWEDPELAEGPASDLNAAALATLGGSYRADDGYTGLVRRALGRIADGGMDKVVTARELHIASALEPIAVLNRLRARYPSCVTFAFGRGSQTFFGATPERLVHFDGLRLQTDALAGSGPRAGDPARDAELAAELQRDPKELTEHAIVVTDVRDTLRACGAALDAPSPIGVMELRRIMHLHTPISGRVPVGTTALQLASALHPTAAVAGLPRRVARDWISQHEGFERGWYAAPVGWTTLDGRGEFRVALRCALTGPTETRLFAGGGIVDGADPEAELAETNIKLEALLYALEDD